MNISEPLLQWYDANARELPWRGVRDPYRIWLSEIMLQQTRAEAVKAYYARFLEAFPNVHRLADAPEDAVLKLWEGLGYYARARNLHACAKHISRNLGGSFPKTSQELAQLPGIGPYTANAIASIAFDEAVPALDGNHARVLTRLLGYAEPLRTPFDLLPQARTLLSEHRPGAYNQALMDLGAVICLPKKPKCAHCPLSYLCTANGEGDPTRYPVRLPKAPKREEFPLVLLVLTEEGLLVRKRESGGLLGGLYTFPMLFEAAPDPAFANVRPLRTLPQAEHVFTHLIWHMRGLVALSDAVPEGWRAVRSIDDLPFPSALRTYVQAAHEILQMQPESASVAVDLTQENLYNGKGQNQTSVHGG